jgi:2-dehydropantoate 2-reductase
MIQNGLPWWYFERVESPWRGTRLDVLDPGGALARSFDLDRVVGGLIYRPVTVTAPGRLAIPTVGGGEKLVIGEIDNRFSGRLTEIARLVEAAGFPVEISGDIRAAKWRKLLLNLLWNPLCALTQSPPGQIVTVAPAAQLVRELLREGAAVAAALGVAAELDADGELERVAGNLRQQPSMLQDVRAGRPLEWEAMLGAVIAMAQLTGVAVPHLRAVGACVAVLDQRIRQDGVAFGELPGSVRQTEKTG